MNTEKVLKALLKMQGVLADKEGIDKNGYDIMMCYNGLSDVQAVIDELKDELLVGKSTKGSKTKARLSALKRVDTYTKRLSMQEKYRGYTTLGEGVCGWIDGFIAVVPSYEHNYKLNGSTFNLVERGIFKDTSVTEISISVDKIKGLQKLMKAELGKDFKSKNVVKIVNDNKEYFYNIDFLVLVAEALQDDNGEVKIKLTNPKTLVRIETEFGFGVIMPVVVRDRDVKYTLE